MIKLNQVFTSYSDYQLKVLDTIKRNYVGVEWLDDELTYTKQESLFNLLMLKYGDRTIRYDSEYIFIKLLVVDLCDLLPDIFAKQQVFIKNKLAEFLSEAKNRAVYFEGTNTNSRDNTSNSKVGNSASPLNQVITSADEISNIPLTSSNISNIKLVENNNSTNQQVNYNFVNDITRALNADYSLRINEFLNLLNKHFVNIVFNNKCSTSDLKDTLMFKNGYKVQDVNYYGSENKEAIQSLSQKVESNLTKIQELQGQVGEGVDLTPIKNDIKQINSQQDVKILTNENEINKVKELQLKQETLISNNTSSINDLRATQTRQGEILAENIGRVATLQNDLGDLGNIVNENTSDININKEQITHLEQSKQNNLRAGANVVISGDEISVPNVGGLTPEQETLINQINNKANKNTWLDGTTTITSAIINGVDIRDISLGDEFNISLHEWNLLNGENRTHFLSFNVYSAFKTDELFNSIYSQINNESNGIRIFVNSQNAYKDVGRGNEVLASEQWVQEQINAKLTRTVISKTCNPNEDTIIVSNLGSYISIEILRKRNDNKWFIWNTQANHQAYIENNQLKIWGSTSNDFTNEYQFIITYLN